MTKELEVRHRNLGFGCDFGIGDVVPKACDDDARQLMTLCADAMRKYTVTHWPEVEKRRGIRLGGKLSCMRGA